MVKRFAIAAVLVAAACSSGAKRDAVEWQADVRDDRLIVPEGITVTALAGGNGVLELFALTLRRTAAGAELYAALRNNGEVAACSAALSVELFDRSERSMAAGIGGLLTQQLYRLTDGSNAIAACVGPFELTMAAVTDLPFDLAIEDVGYIVYRCPYFALDVEPIDGLVIADVTSETGDGGTAYKGTLRNELDVAVDNPSVTIFPVNRAKRPLGAATGSAAVEIPPGGSWVFETDTVDARGVDHLAYPAGALDN